MPIKTDLDQTQFHNGKASRRRNDHGGDRWLILLAIQSHRSGVRACSDLILR